ncbi:MAG: hypothetical protein RSD57_05075 [Comamonas sp.]
MSFCCTNVLLRLIEHGNVYRHCAITGAIDAAVWLWQLWRMQTGLHPFFAVGAAADVRQ